MEDFRELVERSREAILVYREGRAVYANPSCAELFGRSQEELCGALIPPLFEPGPEVQALFAGTPEESGIEAQLLHREGRSIPVEIAGFSPVQFQGLSCQMATLRDVTERQRLRTEILRAASVERQRLAHELHDGLAQQLSGISFKARALQNILEEQLKGEAPAAAEIVRYLGEALAQARHLAHGLDPAVEKVGFAMLMEKLALNTERLFRVACDCQVDHGIRVASPTVAQNLYRIAQEAINNAIRHGQARYVELTLSSDNSNLTLTVSDNGSGYAPPKSNSGMGVRTMQYRAKAMGGTCEIAPKTEGGTTVRCTVPLRSCRANA